MSRTVRSKRSTKKKDANTSRKKTTLFPDVFLYTTTTRDPFSIKYSVECNTFTNVSLSFDWKRSTNMAFHPSPALQKLKRKDSSIEIRDLSVKVTVLAFSNLNIGTVSAVDSSSSSSVSTSYSYKEVKLNDDQIAQYLVAHQREIEAKIDEARHLHGTVRANEQHGKVSVDSFNAVFERSGKPYLDLSFTPNQHSIFHSQDHITELRNEGKLDRFQSIEWKRLTEFMKTDVDDDGEIQVFKDGIEAADIMQGKLGNCWFLSSLAALAETPVLVESLFPPTSRKFNPAGIYEVRFCKNGLWQTVVVDDYFPCSPGSGPMFSRSHGNELWVLLVEKAYAKLHGSYLNIVGGRSLDALMDLTGAPCHKVYFPDLSPPPTTDDYNVIWSQLLEGVEQGYLMATATRGESEVENHSRKNGSSRSNQQPTDSIGLVFGHAYSVLDVCETSQGDRLIKIRNPWGSMEWNGDWSDNSSKWTQQLREEVGSVVEADDGVFWMCLQDLVYFFDSITICMVRIPNETSSTPWHETRIPFSVEFPALNPIPMSNGTTVPPPAPPSKRTVAPPLPPPPPPSASIGSATGMSFTPEQVEVPIFRISVKETTSMIFTIHQRDTRCPNTPDYVDIGFVLLKKRKSTSGKVSYECIDGENWKLSREVQSKQITLSENRSYYLVPLTSGVKLHQFYERAKLSSTTLDSLVVRPESRSAVFTVLPADGGERVQLSRDAIEIYTEIFHRLDSTGRDGCRHRGYLDKDEFDQFIARVNSIAGHPPLEGDEASFEFYLSQFESGSGDGSKGRSSKSTARGLSIEGFLAGQSYRFNQLFLRSKQSPDSSRDPISILESVFYEEIEAFGYSRSSFLWIYGRSFVLSIHSLHSGCKIHTIPYDPTIVCTAQELFIMKYGKSKQYKSKFQLYTLANGYNGTSFLVHNIQGKKSVTVTMDVSGAENVLCQRSEKRYAAVVPPQEKQLIFHLLPDRTPHSWSTNYSLEYK